MTALDQRQTLDPRDETGRPLRPLAISEGAKDRVMASSFFAGIFIAETMWLGGIAYGAYRLFG
jgi:hypothetical protein